MEDTYLTLKKESSGLFKDRGSKFFFYAFPVEDEEEVKELLQELRKKHYDAAHHCFAYNLGYEGSRFRANDDGEPYHSAGDPILGQIRSNLLTNCLIVVVRYFGGTKLGISGLIHAYKTAAAMAIAENEIIEKLIVSKLVITFAYPALNEIMKLVKQHDLEIIDQKMELTCKMILAVRKSLEIQLLASLEEIESLAIKD